MKRALISVALALAPLAGSCASVPGYNAWIISDFCNTGGDDRPWSRTEAPSNAELYRSAARIDRSGWDSVPQDSREYWFTLPNGEIKLCRTNLTRPGGRHHWCNPRIVVWWSFRETESGPLIDNSQAPICLT
ncbi:MAG: hypothetical protein AB7G40_10940 [Hyphomonadaceae bacterium]